MKKVNKFLISFAMILILGVSFLLVGCDSKLEPKTYTINVTSNNSDYGTVYGSGTYAEGEEITIYAVAKEGYEFSHWSDEDTNNIKTLEVNEDVNLTAYFEEVVIVPEPAKYCLNSVEFYLDDYSEISVDRVEIGFAEIFYAYPLYSLGGFNTDWSMVGSYYGLPLYFNTALANENDYQFIVYTDKNNHNVFEEGDLIDFTINHWTCWITLNNDGISVDEKGEFKQDVAHTILVSSTSVTKTFYEDTEHNYKIMIKYNFAEI